MMMSITVAAEIAFLFCAFANLLKTEQVRDLARMQVHDFSRKGAGKLPLPTLINYVIFRHCKDTQSEIPVFFYQINSSMAQPSRQAVNKRLKHLNPQVWPYLSKEFARLFYRSNSLVRTTKGYIALAADSSAVEMPYSEKAVERFGFHKSNHVQKASDSGKVIARCGGLYDVVNRIFVDYIIEPIKKSELTILIEQLHAFVEIIAHKKTIILADRGYVSIRLMIIAQKLGYKYCIRAKRNTYKEEVGRMTSDDMYVNIKLEKSDFSRITDPEAREYLNGATLFRVRVVKNYWQNPETGEINLVTYFTNLSPDEFDKDEIIKLYESRWNVELAYRVLKEVLELERNISLDPDIATNLLYGKIMFYNFTAVFGEQLELLIQDVDHSPRGKKAKRKNKYQYEICMKALINQIYAGELVKCLIDGNNIKQIVNDCLSVLTSRLDQLKTPIRKGRHYKRWGTPVTASYKHKFRIDGRNHPKVALTGGTLRTVKP